MAKKQFKAESKRLLDLMINSIYTHKEIFLREIISNASDAIDKLCYVSLTDDKVGLSREDFRIKVTIDKSTGTITVSDNGIGMTKEDLDSNLGVIAGSGSFKFKNGLEEGGEENADIDIIGQFGVGFYSAFMVSDEVTVLTRAYNGEAAYQWKSAGADGYTIAETEKTEAGTDVVMHIKSDTEDEKYSEYLEEYKLKSLIKRYSDYVRWPIYLEVTGEEDKKSEDEGTRASEEEKPVNSMVPIWQRPKSEVSDEDCANFYKETFHDYTDPVCTIRISAEGLTSYKAMLFIPEKAPFDYYTREFEPGLRLYSSGIMIMEKCADLLPDYFRFTRGVAESPDLSLNISRELLQHDRQLKVIANNIEKKIRAELLKLMKEDREKYEKFYKSFGLQLKYGLVSDYGAKAETLKDLIMFHSSAQGKPITLKEYVEAMPEGQGSIYYACAESVARAEKLPQAEQVRDAGYDILCMTEDVDSFAIQILHTYDEKPFCDIKTDDLGLESQEEKENLEKKAGELRPTLDFIKDALDGAVEDVRVSHKLKSAPVCLATDGEITLEMEKYFANMPGLEGEPVKAKRILEINGSHPAITALSDAVKADPERAKKLSKILLAQATLIADLPLDDPSAYANLVCGLF